MVIITGPLSVGALRAILWQTRQVMAFLLVAISVLAGSGEAHSAAIGEVPLGKLLQSSQHTLVDGIRHAEMLGTAALSVTFGVEDGKLKLSVYAAKNGIRSEAEQNRLLEFKGEASVSIFDPRPEVFEDTTRVARSATQLTLLQVASVSLEKAIELAQATHDGIPYSATPEVNDGRPAVRVLLLAPEGNSVTIDVDLQSGQTVTR